MKTLFYFGIAIAALAGVSACAVKNGYPLPAGALSEKVFVTKGMPAVLYEQEARQVFQVGGRKYELANDRSFAVNTNGYLVIYRRNGKLLARLGEQMLPAQEGVVSAVLSVDGTHYGWVTTNLSGMSVSVDGKTYGAYDSVRDLRFSPYADHFVFLYSLGGQEFVCIDGKVQGGFEEIYGYAFTPDTNVCAYSYHQEWKDYLAMGGDIYNGFIRTDALIYSPDATRKVYIYAKNGTDFGSQFINADEEITGPYTTISNIVFSRNSTKFGFNYSWKGRFFVKINSVTNGPYDLAKGPYFSDEGPSYGFAYEVSNKWYVNINGTVSGTYDSVDTIGFVSNRAGWYVAGKGGRASLTIGTQVIDCGESFEEGAVLPDGYYLVYRDGGSEVVEVNGKRVTAFELLASEWLADERRLTVAGVREGRLYLQTFKVEPFVYRE